MTQEFPEWLYKLVNYSEKIVYLIANYFFATKNLSDVNRQQRCNKAKQYTQR